jgi:hypothetical protein
VPRMTRPVPIWDEPPEFWFEGPARRFTARFCVRKFACLSTFKSRRS